MPGTGSPSTRPSPLSTDEPFGTFVPGTPNDEDTMRITFLGTSFLPRVAQEANSIFVECGTDDCFAFDFGSGVSAKYGAMGIPPSRLTRIFLTHLHGDHTSDLITLYCFGPSQDRKTPLHLYGPSGVRASEGTAAFGENLRKLMKWHVESFSFLPTGTISNGDGYDIATHELPFMKVGGVAYKANGVKITHFPAVHARSGAISYKVEWNGLSMVFSGDTRPNDYMVRQAAGVDVLIHEMVVPTEVWAEKNSGLPPTDPNFPQALAAATAVQQSSHTPQKALGYILDQTQPRLGIATHFQVNDDTIGPAMTDVQSFFSGHFTMAIDQLVVEVTATSITQMLTQVDEYAWYPKPDSPDPSTLAPAKYGSPTAQLNSTLVSHIIPQSIYDPLAPANPGSVR
jgi:ribonuclease Z